LVPAWAKDPRMGNTMINARAETVAEKPAFRKALRHQRCVVLADGFYEWKREGKTKQPYYIHLTDNRPFVFAGLWECWAREGEQPLESCAMVTTGPNALMESIHQRMPVILSPKNYDLWLDLGVQNPQSLLPILQPYPPEEMEAFPTSLIVNNPRNDSPLCVQPLG
ncbi:MAG: SOS response-associated peptidase, partial [Nitrospirales bacterium]